MSEPSQYAADHFGKQRKWIAEQDILETPNDALAKERGPACSVFIHDEEIEKALVKAVSNYSQAKNDEMLEAAKPLIKWLCENTNPHAKLIVEHDSVELFEGCMRSRTEEFIKD